MRYNLSSNKPAFAEYDPALRSLEQSFRRTGIPLSFLADVMPIRGKIVHIRIKGRIITSACIEGDSPAQAVKDVAEAVRL
jgi:hypothetical protein